MDFRGVASYIVIIFNLFVLFYFVAINTVYLLLFATAFVESIRYDRRRRLVDLYEVFRSPLTPSISVLMPAFNEEATIAESVRSALLLRYPRFEVVVINDGSTDRTLEVLVERYALRRVSRAVRHSVPCEDIRGVYISPDHDNLVVVDKVNGGKSDALNAGVNVSRSELICVIDADSLIEPEGLLKVARPFIENPGKTVAVGGLVRIVNGCTVEGGNVTEVRLPRNYWANMQIVEYLRAFLGGRIGWSALRSLLIISGAFGLFRRDVVVEVGGYRRDTVGEDMDLVVRMHHLLRKERRKYRMFFVPDPVCWTEAPERWSQLARQRDRWQRGLIETMTVNLGMLFNPRYGVIGLFAMPYFFFFEMLGPFVELSGYVVVILALVLGMINVQFFILFLSLAFIYAIVVSLFSVMLEGIALRHYPRIKALLQLGAFSVLENFGYRQVNAWWRTRAFFTLFTRRRQWGAMERRGYEEESLPERGTREGAPTGSGAPGVAKPGAGEGVSPGTVTSEVEPPPAGAHELQAAAAGAPGTSPVGARHRRAWRYLSLLLIPAVVLAVVLPLRLTRRGGGGSLSVVPGPVTVGGAKMSARARGRYFDIHTAGGWRRFTVKGVNLGIALPGRWFSEFPEDEKTYRDWFERIAEMNANTVRVYTLLDPVFYRTLDEFNNSSDRKLMLLQEVWPDDEVPGGDLYDRGYTEAYRREIDLDIRALSGRAVIPERAGRAWGEYDVDVSDYLLGLIIGREITWEEARATNSLNPERSGHEGKYVRAERGANAIETWLAETCDFAVRRMRKYGLQAPVGFVSWPTLDPMTHPTENTPGLPKEQEHEDTEVLDPGRIVPGEDGAAGLFGCYHIYPYYPDFMNREPAYGEYRDGEGVLRYGGYLEQFIGLHPRYPALVGEFGVSTSLGVAHLHPEGFHHGGVTEEDQGRLLSRMYRAILDEGYAGGAVFEWHDEWAKRTWVDMDYMIPFDRHIYWHNMLDPEQNFGILAYDPAGRPFEEDEKVYFKVDTVGRDSPDDVFIESISADHDEAFFYLRVGFSGKEGNRLKPGGGGDLELDIGLDTFGDDNGTRRLPVEGLPVLPTGVEFLLRFDADEGGLLLARPDYDRGDSKFMALPAEDPGFVRIELLVNREQVSSEDGTVFPGEFTDQSVLVYGDFDTGSVGYDSLANWYVAEGGETLYVRIPWLLLNVSDPSSLTVLHDGRNDLPPGPAAVRARLGTDAIGTERTEGFRFYAALSGSGRLLDYQPGDGEGFRTDVKRFTWPGWDRPAYRDRLKRSYPVLRDLFGGIDSVGR